MGKGAFEHPARGWTSHHHPRSPCHNLFATPAAPTAPTQAPFVPVSFAPEQVDVHGSPASTARRAGSIRPVGRLPSISRYKIPRPTGGAAPPADPPCFSRPFPKPARNQPQIFGNAFFKKLCAAHPAPPDAPNRERSRATRRPRGIAGLSRCRNDRAWTVASIVGAG